MFQKLSRADLDLRRATSRFPEYVAFVGDLKKGEGGVVDVAAAGVGRQTVKNRLKAGADAVGDKIKFLRSSRDIVVFEVAGKA